MFENLTEKLQRSFKNLRGQGSLTEKHVEEGLREIRLALLEADVNFKVVKQLVANIRKKALGREVLTALSPAEQILKIVRDELVGLLGTKQARLKRKSPPPSVYFMVGLQGSGKTTSSGKLALWLSKQGRKPLLVSVDVHRPAAREQLAIVASQIAQPIYRGAETESSPVNLALGALREARQTGRDTVLVDTAGRLHLDSELMGELEELRDRLGPSEILFVADAMTGQDAVKSAAEFHARISLTGVVLTKMDGDARGGAALSIRQVTGCPVKFLGVGEKPSAFEVFHPDRIVSRLLGMGDMLSLIEKVEEQIDQKQATELQRRVLKNRFTLEDFRKQLQQVRKMGSLKSIVDMLPAAGPFKQIQATDVDSKELSRTEAIISSMTAKERANDSLLNGSRRRRIAAGSGTTVQQVNQVLKQYRQACAMMRGMVPGSKPVRRRRRRRKKRKRGRRRASRSHRIARGRGR
ncbi:MAG: signal recognition particle protein [Bryobacterales bacterium]|nr:signal recognition particle protein [Bryobacterales bacterium]